MTTWSRRAAAVPSGTGSSTSSVALDETGMVVPMVTTNLFRDPVFKDGGFTSNDRSVRRYALRKAMRNIDLAAEFGGGALCVLGWPGGVRGGLRKGCPRCAGPVSGGHGHCSRSTPSTAYNMRFAIEPKPNEPRGHPAALHRYALAFINELEHADMVGINPETGHEQMASLNYTHGIAQCSGPASFPHRPGRPEGTDVMNLRSPLRATTLDLSL